MRKLLTSKQNEVLKKIKELSRKNGSPPTLDQLRIALDYSRTSSVQRHTDALKTKGYLDQSRKLEIISSANKVQIPLMGNISCGQPILATENIEAYICCDSTIVNGAAENYFFLRAIGDSMNNTSINGKVVNEGDFVLCKKQTCATNGDRIIALVEDEATLKRLEYKKDLVVLYPESTNPLNKPIYLFDDIQIQGIACDVVNNGGLSDE